MKKLLMMLAVAAMTVQSASAQKALENSKTFDNWYFGINGGVSSRLKLNDSFFSNVNPSAGLRLGRNWTPVVGWVVEGDVFFRDKAFNGSAQGEGVECLYDDPDTNQPVVINNNPKHKLMIMNH